MNAWLYALLCVAAPLVWGLVVVWLTALIERRVGQRPSEGPHEVPPIAHDDWVI